MTVKELADKYSFQTLSLPDPDREVSGGYIGDLLSWVMGRAQSDNAWITIMTNINVAAVAALTDVAVVIIAEGAQPDSQVVQTAYSKNVNILSSLKTAYETTVMISDDI